MKFLSFSDTAQGETDEIFLLYILSGTPVSSCHDRTGNGTLGLIF
jgi:hypothetical protein